MTDFLQKNFKEAPIPSPSPETISKNQYALKILQIFSAGSADDDEAAAAFIALMPNVAKYFATPSLDDLALTTLYGRAYKLYASLHSLSLSPPSCHSLSLSSLDSKYSLILSPSPCPKRRFGSTGKDVSLITCGSMRYQQSWKGSKVKTETLESDVEADVQSNLEACILHAFRNGVNHFETARGYGTSEHQMGIAFKSLIGRGELKREHFYLQTKVNPKPTKEEFRAEIEKSLEALQVDYVDFFAFHGLNKYRHWDDLFGPLDLYSVAMEYKARGVFKHIGFSTHGTPDLTSRFVASGKFEYVNLHHHAFGSYTASGTSFGGGVGMSAVVEAARERGMGVFCISPVDKGGALHNPSPAVSGACWSAGLGAVEYGAGWAAAVHDTMSVGMARVEDMDEPLYAAHLVHREGGQERVAEAEAGVRSLMEGLHGKAWLDTCYEGLPHCFGTDHAVSFGMLVWLYNLREALGMGWFTEERFKVFRGNRKGWDEAKSPDENRVGWGYTPGLSSSVTGDYSEVLKDVREENRERIEEILKVWAPAREEKGGRIDEIDFRPWVAYPER
mmetsp:Transcript_28361/g.56664  ORF Transcript_28361/g.56664 Transcript_28361/m.56664 type:complete len:560 (+) Transcript_28361:17-1696(+)